MVADLQQVKRAVITTQVKVSVPARTDTSIQYGAVRLKDRTIHYGCISEVIFAGKPFVKIQAGEDFRLIAAEDVSQIVTVAPNQLLLAKLSLDQIIGAVCEYFTVPKVQLVSKKRPNDLCLMRFIAFALARDLNYSYSKIGQAFNRDHGTVMSGIRSLRDLVDTDTSVAKVLDELRGRLHIPKPVASIAAPPQPKQLT